MFQPLVVRTSLQLWAPLFYGIHMCMLLLVPGMTLCCWWLLQVILANQVPTRCVFSAYRLSGV